MNQHLQNILKIVQQDERLTAEQKETIAKSLKDADKDLEITAFKLEKTEKVKRTTSILLEETIEELEQKRKAVEAQNKELAIESSLERVRAVAMGMRKPGDLLDICQILYTELLALGFGELRNAMINIHNDDKAFLLNYDYSDNAGKTVTNIPYNFHPLVEKQVLVTKNAQDAFFEFSFTGEELKQFRELRKNNGELDDAKLEITDALHYYFYSIGTGSIGISTYSPVNEEKLKLLKRFRNVFNLSWQRYTDITQAEAQAREAKIEAALERARTQSMIMQHSSELSDTLQVFHQQLQLFGINSDFSYLWLPDEENDKHLFWAVWEEEINDATIFKNNALTYPLDRDEPYTATCLADWKSGVAIHAYKVAPAGVKDYFAAWGELFSSAEKLKAEFFPDGFSYVEAYMKYGCFGIAISRVLMDEEKQLLRRFTIEFERAYTRFLDLKKAEAQAREAQIELALERVRARTMAMQKSEELAETSLVLFQQFKDLGETSEQISIGIFKEDKNIMELYSTLYGSQWKEAAKVDLNEPVVMKKIHAGWKGQKKSLVIDITGNDLKKYNAYRKKLSNLEFREDRWVIHIAFFSKGVLTFSTTESHPQETIQLLERFAGVFDQTYTRFLDLQKAEAQARESQIQLAMERVRARTMAMQHSDELSETATVLFEQLNQLGEAPERAFIGVIDEEEHVIEIWATLHGGNQMNTLLKAEIDEPFVMNRMYTAWKEQKKSIVIDLQGHELEGYFQYLKGKGTPVKRDIFGDRRLVNVAFFSNGMLGIITTEPRTAEAIVLYERFAGVFDLTYTRFLDLQKAEAQARESKIELGLERVRARAMAMQKSGELSELVDTVFKELTKLDFALTWCIINIIDEPSLSNTVWAANPDINKAPESYHMLFEEYPFHHAMMKGWKERNAKSVYTLEGEEKRIYDDYLFSKTEFKRTPGAAQAASRAMEKYVVSFSFSNFGGLQTVGDVPLSDANLDILSRFGKVFDLTYTRFNDLKQAEAQARESQIQLALERVRARTMAMQHSDELQDAAKVMFEQMEGMGLQTGSCGFNIWDKKQMTATVWMSSAEGGLQTPFILPHTESEIYQQVYEAMKKGEDFLVKEVGGKTLKKHFDYLLTLPGIGDVIRELRETGYLFPETIVYHFAFFTQGYLSFHLHEHHTETHEIFKRFAKVFEQTYTRFFDLQKAEAQARESQVEAALEKVRSHTMGMRSSDDLAIVAAVMFDQMRILGADLFSFGIVLCDKHENMVEQWHGIPHTGMLAPFFVPVNLDHIHQYRYDQWKAGVELFSIVIPEDYIAHHFELMLELPSVNAVWEGLAAKGISLPPIPTWEIDYGASFKYGYLLVSALKPFEEDKIFPRFAKVFEQAYTRFLDLQKAEAQAREAKIEAALERVRSKTMAMHKSDELKEIIIVVSEQLQKLGYRFSNVSFITHNADYDVNFWMSAPGVKEPILLQVPYLNNPAINHFKQMVENDIWFSTDILTADESLEWNQHVIKTTWLKDAPQETKNYLLRHTPLAKTNIRNKHIAFAVGNYAGIPYKDEENEVFKRFANVFEQSYTRFLDLQKAEAQAREAKIEAALEKVRSRSLAMYKSEELQEVVTTVLERLQDLDIQTDAINLDVFNENKKDAYLWTAVPDHNYSKEIHIPYNETTIFKDIYEGMISGKEIHSKVYSRELKDEFLNYVFEHTDFRYLPEERKEMLFATDGSTVSVAYAKNTAIIAQRYRKDAFSDDDNEILKRFARVFEQAYTRFLDLQKAEAQAREGQIQLAMERVRARTMAMQRSDELQDAASLMVQQIQTLGVPQFGSGFNIWDDDRKAATAWMCNVTTDNLPPPFKTSSAEDIFLDIHDAAQRGETLFVREQAGKELETHYKYMNSIPIFREYVESVSSEGLSIPDFQIMHCAFFSQGYLMFITYKPVPEAYDIFIRFAKVFEQTYTRFLDLQKAEAQAREGQIEAALERVRSRSMGMQKSEELKDVIRVVYEQFVHLNIHVEHTGFIMDYKERNDMHIWLADKHAVPFQVTIPYFDCAHWNSFNEAKGKGIDFFANKLSFEEKNKFYQDLFKVVPGVPEETLEYYFSCPGLAISTVLLENVGLYIENFSGIPYSDDENSTLMRFGKVFQQTYTRFLDLQKAEVQAREAQIELALERVRARTMAMQKSDELLETAVVLFDQLSQLGEHIERTIIGVINEEERVVNFWATRPDGSQMEKMQRLPIDEPIVMQKIYAAWRQQKKSIVIDLRGEELERYFLFLKGRSPSLKRESFGERRVENFAFFSKGILGIISADPNTAPNVEVYERFAAVFDQTYTRFLDLQKAEAQAKESQIQLALERVRARTMAMQKSDELREAVLVIYQQLQELDFGSQACNIIIIDKDTGDEQFWVSGFTQEIFPESYHVPRLNHHYQEDQFTAWRNGVKYAVFDYTGKEKKEFDKIFFTQTDFSKVPEQAKQFMIGLESIKLSTAFTAYGSLQILGPEPLSEEKATILKRFAKVFEQTYTRFLDLQKAEAQVREAQIEAALEKVRSRSLAMHTANELGEVVTVIVEKLKDLGVVLDANGVVLCTYFPHSKDVMHWIVSPDHSMAGSYLLPYFDHPIFNAAWQSKENGDEYFSRAFSVAEKNSFFEHAFEHSDYRHFPDEFKQWIFQNNQYILSFAWQKNSAILIPSHTGVLPSVEDIAILKRFAKVFEQSYVRFLDLQKAEAQARESQIQLALERVRARTMAMQKSEELPETSYLLFQQVKELGLTAAQNSIAIINEETGFVQLSTTVLGHHLLHTLNVPIDDPYVMAKAVAAWKANRKSLKLEFVGQELKNYNEHRNSFFETKVNFPEDQWIVNIIFFSKGWLSFSSNKNISGETFELLKRFAAVFEQTYIRFNDLKQAEEQVKESQIQLALERVRARTMAMQHSDELKDAAALLFQQVKSLGVPAYSCGYNIWEKDDKEFTSWMSTQDGSDFNAVLNIPLTEDANFIRFAESRRRREQFFVLELRGERMQEHYEYLKTIPAFKAYFDYAESVGFDLPVTQIHQVANFSQGNLLFISLEPCPEFHDVFKRFAAVFEQTYTRFLDLQKAEAQARESQIETALERVRSKTMAMHNSNDVGETVAVMFTEFENLGMHTNRCGILILSDHDVAEVWTARSTIQGKANLVIGKLELDAHIMLRSVYNAWKANETFYKYDLLDDDLVLYYTAINNSKYYPALFDLTALPPKEFHCDFFFADGAVFSFTKEPVKEEFAKIMKRFAAVFGQTYRRYLDLQKAEAQAREAQIETALEKVRSRSLAMHKSDELQEVVHTVFEKLKELDVELYTAIIIIFTEGSKDMIWWLVNKASQQYAKILVPYRDNYYVKDIFDAKEKGKDFFSATYSREEKNDLFYHLFENTEFKYVPEQQKQFLLESDMATMSVALTKYTGINITSYTKNAFSEKENEILKRFAKVFDQAYTRFLDLQRAEAQAREAQIEAALERVRSRAMAMQGSDELNALIGTVFTELTKLELVLTRSVIFIYEPDGYTCRWWMANSESPSEPANFLVNYDEQPFFQAYRKAWQEKILKWAYELQGEDKVKTDDFLFKETELSRLPDFVIDGMRAPATVWLSASFNNFGCLTLASLEPLPEEHFEILLRFARVFDLTYTRFNDLKKAEAQAREAKIEAALERVRGKAMAMHNSNDLSVTASMVFTELRKLGINPVRCGVSLQTKESRKNLLYYSIPSPKGDTLSLAGSALLSGHPVLSEIYDSWLRNEDYFPVLKGESLINYYQTLKQAGFDVPVSPSGHAQYGYYIAFSEGMFYGWVEKSFTESEIKILKRFASVIDLTFRRYIELQKSEANAKEAVKQAALDRIRADIASMRTVADLDRITPLIWNELNILGIPFIRCGVFIMDDSQQLIHTFLSSPDGNAIAAFHLPYDTPGNLSKVLSHWNDHQNYVDHWDQSAFTELAGVLVKQGAIASPGQYLDTIPHGGFYLHFLPFLQGMLYVGNTTQLSDDDIHLIQSVADAFSTAYARYEDFNKLEAAKQTVDKTLVDLKQAQTQLVQSEKMASLGELTAGIAHEIQNPLNFVNNFSEVSNELLDEMIAELGNGTKEDAIAIANDVKQNLEKILHHGKRADGIVKGMLQHSRSSTAIKEPTDINKLADEYLRLAYHGLRAKDKSFNATLKTDFDESIGSISIIPQDIGRAVLNLITNAFYVVGEKNKQTGNGYEPTVSVSTKKMENSIEIRVADNGNGIPPKVLDKVFQPFFTTKPTGQGTGLGLSLSYDVVKAHGGELKVTTREGEGSEFIIQLPVV